jgi:hypothetical protein
MSPNHALRITTAARPAPTDEALHDVRETLPQPPQEAVSALLVDSRTAAKILAVSERTLWTLTDRGEVPCV